MTPAQWAQTAQSGVFPGSAVDHADGYVHLSTAAQTVETVRRHFADAGDLLLGAVRVEDLGAALRFEASRGGDLFPHFYGQLKETDFLWTKAFDSQRLDDLQILVAG